MPKPPRLSETKARDTEAPPGLWPVDKVILTYLAITSLLIIAFISRLPQAWWLLSLKALGAILIIVVVRKLDSVPGWYFRHWYPLLYVAASYKEMSILIHGIRRGTADAALARIDYAVLRVHPTVWIERLHNPLLTEYLQIVYSFFIPALLVVALIIWRRRRVDEFRRYAFLISLGFLVSYLFYFLVPARGPRFLLSHLQQSELSGVWMFERVRNLLDRLEGIHYDCFPSGHTLLTLLAWWSSRRISRLFFFVFTIFTVSQVFSTVYLRYHYVVDLVAGAVFAIVILVTRRHLYRALAKVTGSTGNHENV
ncbi:MAG: phosphatase PAP2 family protein [Pyrinomonadaceae bacterium]